MSTPGTLYQRIQAANDAYRAGNPIMSDAAYDSLEEELRKLDPNHVHFTKVGAAPSSGWSKVSHSIPMGSLNKAQTSDDLKAWWPGHPVCITHKLDGISISLRYADGKLVQALTRGDGDVGEDITRNVLLMKGAVKVLPKTYPGSQGAVAMPAQVFVRGEIVCRKSDFTQFFPGESNPRNTAAGTAKRQSDPTKCKHLTVVAYQFLPDGITEMAKSSEIEALQDMGFTVPPAYIRQNLKGCQEVYDKYVAQDRDNLDWEIDGLVIDIDDASVREALGSHNQRPKGAIAFKFPHDQKATTLQAIRWQVGRSGRVTPVADFTTVKLAGANVSKASLHNLDYINTLASSASQQHLFKGDEILVARRNDVIPYVEAVLVSKGDDQLAFRTPTECPECTTTLVQDGAYIRCPNGDTCPAQIAGSVKRWISKIGVLHFGEALIDMLCETGKVEGIADLYSLDPAEVANMGMSGRQVGGTATKAFKNLHANKTFPIHVFVGSLGIPMIGRSMAKTIADAGFDTLNKMSKATIAQIEAIPGVGQSKAQAFVVGFWDLLDKGVITSLLQHISIAEKATGAFSGKTVCMTGFRDKQMEAEIEAQGGTVKSSVSKTLSLLVAKDPTSTSGKAKQAAKHGVEVIGVDDMWDRLGGRP